MDPLHIVYTDRTGAEHTETVTSPIALVLREEELQQAGYTIIH